MIREDPGEVALAVVAAHRTGQPLHHELLALGARFARRARTAPVYRLIALPGPPPGADAVPRGGIVLVGVGGTSIEVELHRLRSMAIGALLSALPPPLAVGHVQLAAGTALGIVCLEAPPGALDISAHGSWPAYLATHPTPSPANAVGDRGERALTPVQGA